MKKTISILLRCAPVLVLVLGLGLLAGCTSTSEGTMSDQDLQIDQAEPDGGAAEAPPFGSPREKLAPDEVVKKQKEEEEREAEKAGRRGKLGGPTGKKD